jgi:two-component system, chemotaxis family, response regulator Rcp1
MSLERPAHILMVDDSEADRDLVAFAFEDVDAVAELHEACDGAEALAFLRGEGDFAGKPRPDLILLDLNMPGMDGREFLERMRADPELCDIPVAVMTTSAEHTDIVRSYGLGANCYVIKPVDLDKLVEVARALGEFWFGLVKLPTG